MANVSDFETEDLPAYLQPLPRPGFNTFTTPGFGGPLDTGSNLPPPPPPPPDVPASLRGVFAVREESDGQGRRPPGTPFDQQTPGQLAEEANSRAFRSQLYGAGVGIIPGTQLAGSAARGIDYLTEEDYREALREAFNNDPRALAEALGDLSDAGLAYANEILAPQQANNQARENDAQGSAQGGGSGIDTSAPTGGGSNLPFGGNPPIPPRDPRREPGGGDKPEDFGQVRTGEVPPPPRRPDPPRESANDRGNGGGGSGSGGGPGPSPNRGTGPSNAGR